MPVGAGTSGFCSVPPQHSIVPLPVHTSKSCDDSCSLARIQLSECFTPPLVAATSISPGFYSALAPILTVRSRGMVALHWKKRVSYLTR